MHETMIDNAGASMAIRWRDLTGRYSCSRASTAIYDGLVRRYAAPERHYHTLRHIGEVLDLLDRYGRAGRAHDTALFAAWFHDVIYDARATDNEERSAAMARRALWKLDVPDDLAEDVARLILATKEHEAVEHGFEGELLLDADLAILGADDERYREYERDIRREYAWASEEEYRAGRARVLTELLARERIYRTGVVAAELEERARRNMRGELDRLGKG
jgi:predicted metal-dependent HD superfamily phosphohydrolase